MQRSIVSAMVTVAILVAAQTSAAVAQSWPTKSITLVVPFPAGGSTDGIGRPIANMLAKELGQEVVVENRAGAAGNIGAATVARAAPDGYTLLLATTGPAATNKLLYKNLSFDSATDFSPIAMIGVIPQVITVSPKLPVSDLKQLVEYAKANPGKLNIGNSGNGTMAHIAAVSFARQAGIQATHVPYKGVAQLISDILGSQIEFGFPGFIPSLTQAKVVAVTSSERLKNLPNAPTLKESGYDVVAGTWFGILGPAKMPAEIVERINKLVNEYIGSTEGQALLAALGMQAIPGTPQDMKAFMAAELARWEPIVRAGNMKLQ
jgi:tripartite-type tricarboxylate transporter receptor subunit TctC